MNDRHGRVAHGDGDRRRRPASGFRMRSARRFTELVEDCLDALPRRVRRRIATAQLRVVDVPPDAPPGDRVAVYDPVAQVLTVFRRAAELRANTRAGLTDVVRHGVTAAVAEASDFFADDLGDPWFEHDE